jgi:hypothetical protein
LLAHQPAVASLPGSYLCKRSKNSISQTKHLMNTENGSEFQAEFLKPGQITVLIPGDKDL